MNAAHIHLLLNHFPVVGVLLGVLLTGWGMLGKHDGCTRAGLLLFLLSGVLVIPVYLTGEPAEEVVEKLAGVSEQMIEQHEESALFTLAGLVTLGAVSGVLLFLRRRRPIPERWVAAALFLSAAVAAVSIWTANLGGKIHHPEARGSFDEINQPDNGR